MAVEVKLKSGKKNHTVHVNWEDSGFSRGSTDSYGVFVTSRNKGKAAKVEVFGESKPFKQEGDLITVFDN